MYRKKIYKNRVSPVINDSGQILTQDEADCEKCGEYLVFAMRDKYHEFSMSLYTVLQCLSVAEKEGCVPKLPDEWWIDIAGRYN